MKKKLLLGLLTTTLLLAVSTQVNANTWSYNQPNEPQDAKEGDYWERNVGDGIDSFYFKDGKWKLTFSTSQRREKAAEAQNNLARQREAEIDRLNQLRDSYMENAMQDPNYYQSTPESEVEYVYINQITITSSGEKRFKGTVRIPKVEIPERLPEYYVTPYVDANVPEFLPIIGDPYPDSDIPEKIEVTQNEPSDWVKDQIEWAKHLEEQQREAEKESREHQSNQNNIVNGNSANTSNTEDETKIIDKTQAGKAMYRVYNPNSGEHFYTSNMAEKNHLLQLGWRDEGISWYAPTSGEPVYRVYNPNNGDHHYTKSLSEKSYLVKIGWRDEGIGWYSQANGKTRIHRLYNPYALTASHHYTSNQNEINVLVEKGWKYEGTAWFGV